MAARSMCGCCWSDSLQESEKVLSQIGDGANVAALDNPLIYLGEIPGGMNS